MLYKKYNTDSNYSYTFGAFPTFELLTNQSDKVKEIILHEKLTQSPDTEKILKLAKDKNIKISADSHFYLKEEK